jgi:tRNA G10  N-methylase Trm11
MHIAILGRQPALSVAELERVYPRVRWFSDLAAIADTEVFDIERLGGTQKAGRVTLELPAGDWRRTSLKIVQHYAKAWSARQGKLTLGISAYGFDVSARDVQKTGLILKTKLKTTEASLRLIPNQEAALNTAASHHNKLGLADNKIELLVVRGQTSVIVAESVGAQNITALAARDQDRPKRDAFVGMLPPKLAQMMLNMAGPLASPDPKTSQLSQPRILDPFCGTGVLLQEAMLMGYGAYGTDLAEKMIRYSRDNLNWLQDKYRVTGHWYLHEGDAMTTQWQQPVNAVVCETYLGQPFSAPPSAAKLTEVRGNCNHIVGEFLKNLAPQLASDTPVVLAIPAWRDTAGTFTHLPLVDTIETFGFSRVSFKNVRPDQLLYFRPDQVVARELLILQKQ